MSKEMDANLICRVRQVLEERARKRKLVSYGEIEEQVGVTIASSQWNKMLDPIYEELRHQGEPDLTAIVVYKSGPQQGYPPYFSDGGEARSKPFNPNNLRQLGRWQAEVGLVFAHWRSGGSGR
jgi:hypothetical protein